ncbi:WxL domain-containing protein [Schleiferilactobacillus perolens]|jgi:hypothetical protein|uniref:WxL domain-containing protein n=1 Tax=Schleiferilactobacillus perolens TaxID=100468 RepID=UPI002353C3DF|nr:WxL domain-containing protein [Schleiferilactobacillus perolens]MCI2172155.1 WxL domain-containing protein [Schleiferilactobacillus perolens]
MRFNHAKQLTAALVGGAALLAAGPISNTYAAATAGGVGPGDSGYNLSVNTTATSTTAFFAATTTTGATANTTAEFTILGGALELDAVPDFNFGQVAMATIYDGGDQGLVNNTVSTDATVATSKNNSARDGNTAGLLAVNDLRGTGSGWTLKAQLGPAFTTTDKNAASLSGITLSLSGSATAQIGNADVVDLLPQAPITTTATTIATAPAGHGLGKTAWSLTTTKSATLHFSGETNPVVPNAVYQSDITWTLGTGA